MMNLWKGNVQGKDFRTFVLVLIEVSSKLLYSWASVVVLWTWWSVADTALLSPLVVE